MNQRVQLSTPSKIRLAIVSGFGIGWMPASGTIVSLLAALLILKFPTFIETLFSVRGITTVFPIVAIVTVGMGFLIGTTEENFRRRIAIDHLIGMVLAFAFVTPTPKMILLAFVLYRFYDIVKPWPIHYLTDMKQGIGSFLDDFASGLLTAVTLLLIKLAYGELMSYL